VVGLDRIATISPRFAFAKRQNRINAADLRHMPPRETSDSGQIVGPDHFRHQPDEGAIRLSDGQRAAAASQEFIQHLHESLARDLGDSARHLLYACGYEWGLQDMVRLTHRLRADRGAEGVDLWHMDAKLVLDSWWAPLTAGGWGVWTLDLTALSKGLCFVEVRNSAIAATRTGASAPVCHLYAGLFAGALSFFRREETHATEIQCAAMGHPACEFVVAPGAQIDAIERWQKQGADAAEVRRRLA
jgi:uncharacterized protein